jgi:hypothetical protein
MKQAQFELGAFDKDGKLLRRAWHGVSGKWGERAITIEVAKSAAGELAGAGILPAHTRRFVATPA